MASEGPRVTVERSGLQQIMQARAIRIWTVLSEKSGAAHIKVAFHR